MVKCLLKRSRRGAAAESLSPMALRKQRVCLGSDWPSTGIGSCVPPVSMLPPWEVTYQSQLPPLRLPPTIELRTITATLAFGGTSGTKSDSATPLLPSTWVSRRKKGLLDEL